MHSRLKGRIAPVERENGRLPRPKGGRPGETVDCRGYPPQCPHVSVITVGGHY